jgi:hypothetical protein
MMDSRKRLSLAWKDLREIHPFLISPFGKECVELDLSNNQLE